jgi:hypothetical protein
VPFRAEEALAVGVWRYAKLPTGRGRLRRFQGCQQLDDDLTSRSQGMRNEFYLISETAHRQSCDDLVPKKLCHVSGM